MNIDEILKEMNLAEKAALLSGTEFMFSNSIPRLGIPSLCLADGPHGLRKQTGTQDNGISQSEPATAFPTAAATASSWNPANAEKMGEAIADECLYYGVNVLLGPAVNIKKNPTCGRNFEYFSEDPYLSGVMGAEFVKGVQKKKVGVSLKHFAANNSENYRFMGQSIVDMRALREIYLKGFEHIVKDAAPATAMCAYNTINGTFCSENKWLLTDVLRNQWGFDGIVMTDWGATKDRVEGVRAGLDLEMPGDTHCRKQIMDAIKSGALSETELDLAVSNMLRLIERCAGQKKVERLDKKAHHDLAGEIAKDSAVLLKNDGSLPLERHGKLLIMGELFEKMRYQGAGSSMINPAILTTPKDAFDTRKINYEYARGYLENSFDTDESLLSAALTLAEEHDRVLVFAGLNDFVESEGCDRPHMRLPQNQIDLIESLIAKGKRVILVLFGGSPIELPFAGGACAILHMYLPGQNGGEAAAALLFGEANPCGKLAETWVQSYQDVPFHSDYSKTIHEIYRESIFVGYRYYQTAQKQVLFPFGYGLSYTQFDYQNLKIQESEATVTVRCDIRNIGAVDGAEIVQLYIKNNQNSKVFKPEKELRGFTKVSLQAGETKTVVMTFDKADLCYFDMQENAWVLENGVYEIQVCASSEDVRLTANLEISGQPEYASPYPDEINGIYKDLAFERVSDTVFEEMSGLKIPALPPKLPLTMESRFSDFTQTWMGRFLFKAVTGVAKKQRKQALKLPEGTERDNRLKGATFLYRILESNSIRSFCMSAGESMPIHIAEGFVLLANGHLIKGVGRILKKEKMPPLPKNLGEKDYEK